MKLGDILRNLMEDNNISQKELANELSIPVSTLGNYIRNIREPDYETLKRIAKYFTVTTDYLLNYHYDINSSLEEEKLLLYYRIMSDMHKELFIEHAKVYVKHTIKKTNERRKNNKL